MKKIIYPLLFLFLAAPFFSNAQYVYVPETSPPPASQYDHVGVKTGYTKIFQDEFDGSSLNTNDWKFYNYPAGGAIMANGVSHISFQSNDMNNYNNSGIVNKSVRLDLVKIPPTVVNGQSYTFESVQFSTNRDCGYGYYEARVKYDFGKGAWPAFWLYGNDGAYNSTYTKNYSEIDIFENFPESGESRIMSENAYVWNYNFDVNPPQKWNESALGTLDGPLGGFRYYIGDIDLSSEYHIYGMEFSPNKITWYLDGKEIRYTTRPEILQRMLQKMWITFDMYVIPNYSTPNSTSTYVDYVRYYKKNPVITPTASSNCVTTNTIIPFSVTTQITTDVYSWQAVSGCTLDSYSGTKNENAKFKATGNGPIQIRATATDVNGSISSSVYTFPSINSDFTLTSPFCQNGNSINISASCSTPTGIGSQFDLWNVDPVTNHFTGSPIQTLFGTNITFTGLTQGKKYAVTHGVWDSCTPWSFTEKIVTLDLSDFTYTQPTCVNNQLQFSATASSNSGGNGQWLLYSCDSQGNISNWTTVSPAQNGPSCTFTNLQPNSYYALFQGIYYGCVSSWTANKKVIYVPNYGEDPFFSNTVRSANSTQWTVADTSYAPNGSQYAIYNSNSTGALGTIIPNSQTGATWQFGTIVSFGPPAYNLQKGNYYLVVHGVYSGCGTWRWLGSLITNTGTVQKTNPFSDEDVTKIDASLTESGSELEIKLYPNPASDKCTVAFSKQAAQTKIQLLTMDGKEVYISEVNDNTIDIDLSTYEKGIYLIRVTNEHGTVFKKLVHL